MIESRTRIRPSTFLVISPPVLACLAWTLGGAATFAGYTFYGSMPLLQRFMMLNKVSYDLSPFGIFWVVLSLFFFIATCLLVMGSSRAPGELRNANFSRGLQFVARFHFFALGVTLLWIAVSAAQLGGLGNLIRMTQESSYETRQVLLQNKLFVGMRLLYASFVATGAYGAFAYAYHLRTGALTAAERLRSATLFVTAAAALFILPIVMSQRILLFLMVLSAYVGSIMISGRYWGIKYLPFAAAFLFIGWSIPDYLTLTQTTSIQTSVIELGYQKLIFYFSNDMFNAIQPLGADIDHTYGVFSTQFLQAFTFTLAYFRDMFRDVFRTYDDMMGGGTFPMFTAPYIDFGVFGLVFISFVAMAMTIVFEKAKSDARYALFYGIIGASLILGTHSAYYTHQNFWMWCIIFGATSYFMKDRKTEPYQPRRRRFRAQPRSTA